MKLQNRVRSAASAWVLGDFFSQNTTARWAAAKSGKVWRAGLIAAQRHFLQATLALLILAACHRDQEQVATFAAAAAHTAGWSIHNTSDGDVQFSLTVNDKFWRSRQQMIDEIASYSRDTQTFVIRAAEWVHRYSRNITPLSADNWIHSPELFINSLGLGYCDDRAAVLASLWQAYGLRTRMWNLQGHVVPEVFVHGKWQPHDPDMYGAVQVANRLRDTRSLFYHINPNILATQQYNKLVMRGKKVDRLLVNWYEYSQAYSPPRYLDDVRNYFLSKRALAGLVRTLPVPQSFDQLPAVFRRYYQLQGMSAEELVLREHTFMSVFQQLLPFAQSRPAFEKLFLQNPVYQILLFELCQTLDPQDVLTYLNNLSL